MDWSNLISVIIGGALGVIGTTVNQYMSTRVAKKELQRNRVESLYLALIEAERKLKLNDRLLMDKLIGPPLDYDQFLNVDFSENKHLEMLLSLYFRELIPNVEEFQKALFEYETTINLTAGKRKSSEIHYDHEDMYQTKKAAHRLRTEITGIKERLYRMISQ
ncbi:TPA: hypothetical protein RQJ54_000174 [Vibrio vulnificus]|uniref:hypothetical protein n=1 Tax=Vibrio vulnificus TaxID=672 RepID=UPI001CC0FB35|nr:hypothetical protein [Vibrio vulnificus]HDY7522314.1 hypothetical protein [Vibrio vulnificus]